MMCRKKYATANAHGMVVVLGKVTWSMGAVDTAFDRLQSTTAPVIFKTPQPAARLNTFKVIPATAKPDVSAVAALDLILATQLISVDLPTTSQRLVCGAAEADGKLKAAGWRLSKPCKE